MKRSVALPLVSMLFAGVCAAAPQAETRTAERIVARYLEARGGAERWRALETLEMSGSYTAFSTRSRFNLIRQRGDLYRLDFTLLSAPAIRARDAVGAWGQDKWIFPEPQRITEGPYKARFEREAVFGPLLLDYRKRGIKVRAVGAGSIDGRATAKLEVTLADGSREIWHLDPVSFLEVAVDSIVFDFTQDEEPKAQRAFFGDFREVGGLVIPHAIDLEFGQRLESMRVTRVEIDAPIERALFSPPPARPPG